jgi:hypothetical protein
MCGTIKRTFGTGNKERQAGKFHKTMALRCLLYGSETWTLRRIDERRLKAAEMWSVRCIAGYAVRDKGKSGDISHNWE